MLQQAHPAVYHNLNPRAVFFIYFYKKTKQKNNSVP